jgi:hypothetical protein
VQIQTQTSTVQGLLFQKTSDVVCMQHSLRWNRP